MHGQGASYINMNLCLKPMISECEDKVAKDVESTEL